MKIKIVERSGINPSKNLFGNFDTQQELDAEYDVEKAVSNFPNYIQDYVDSSLEARRTLKGRKEVKYGPTLMERLTIYPAKNPLAPVLVFIHGGYWKMGTGDEYEFIAMGPWKAGFTVVIVTYSLAPNVSIPEMIRQVRASVAWTATNIADFNGDPAGIFIAGHSAGAHLAAMTVITDWSDYGLPQETIKGMLALSGLYDLLPVSQTFVQPSLRITSEQVLNSSPIRQIRSTNIPVIVAWGDQETEAFQKQSSEYLFAWKAAGNTGRSRIIAGANHFSILESFKNPEGEMTGALISLMDTYL